MYVMIKRIVQGTFIFFLFIAAGYLIIKIGSVAYEKYTLQLQINKVKSQIAKLENNNEELKILLAQLGSEEFLKLKVKEDFNLKEQGENVVFVRGIAKNETGKRERKEAEQWERWWDIFFGKR